MAKKIFILFLLAGMAYSLKAQQPQTPQQLNDYMVGIIDSITMAENHWDMLRARADSTHEFYRLYDQRRSIEKMLERKFTALSDLGKIEESDDFRDAVNDYLFYVALVVKDGCFLYEKLNKNSSPADIDRVRSKTAELKKDEAEGLQNVRKVQQEYALRNGLTIKP